MATTARSLPDSGLVVTGTEVWLEEGAEEDFEEEGAEEEHKEEEEVVTLTEDRRVTHRDISSMSETKGESTLKGSLAGKETKEIYIDESRISGTLKQETEEGKKYISVSIYI